MTPSLRVVRLHEEHPVHAFTCGTRPGAADIDQYLREHALIEQAAHLAAVWVVENLSAGTPADQLVGFFTLSPVSVRLSTALLASINLSAPYQSLGGWLLGRMGLAVGYQGRNYGPPLVAEAIRMAPTLRDTGAGPLLVVDPKNDALMRWYLGLDFGFTRLAPADPRLRRLALKL